ncbi:MAG: hypothetical protein WC862_04170 [Patescibacteria group bacterium]
MEDHGNHGDLCAINLSLDRTQITMIAMIYQDMQNYFKWNEQTITDFSDQNINSLYNQGYLFTRVGKGVMQETRSVRIDLSKFELSSENRRVLRKIEDLRLKIEDLPYENYSWEMGKMAKDFYDNKFGKGTFSANKVKELLTGNRKDFNKLFVYSQNDGIVGYCIVVETNEIIHYSFPFYSSPVTHPPSPNTGMGMMVKAVEYAKQQKKEYIYLGSFQRPTDTYKLQFRGLEWWNGSGWKTDIQELKNLLIDTRI